jgi:anaerobic nitric oxide reductase transcription regulator
MTEPAPPPAADPDRILLVDDDPANLDILRQALDGRGYKLLVATSGEDALQRQLAGRNAELQRKLAVAQELLADARRRVDGPLVGESPAARALRESIVSHAGTLDALVLTGPHGAGQEAVARAIHHASPRSRQPFIHVNCALLAAGQTSSLFAAAGTPDPGGSSLSQLDLAERGTLFLEEVHRMPADLQERLAAVLEAAARQRERGEPASPDVRVLASTSGSPSATTASSRSWARAEWARSGAPGTSCSRAPAR